MTANKSHYPVSILTQSPMKELWIRVLSLLGMAHWVVISTSAPRCTYYFGPFARRSSAEKAQLGYLEDLRGEGAQDIQVTIKQCKPARLTIFDEAEELMPILSP
ncbi:hypothetical protein BWK47_09320 [Synechocystis sp. CACIAM 05]|nr:DUF1816 domain-containing protein [Synechocystis sp. CACIAM 05]QHV00309.1 hypothetical protein BWK47_09320 [Synechocystis sp. CACIAM 05]